MGFYDTYIIVKLTISRIECHLLDERWMLGKPTVCNRLSAPDFQKIHFCEFIYMSPNLQILNPIAKKLIYIVLNHIFKEEKNNSYLKNIRVMPLVTVQYSKLSHNIHSKN